MASWFEVDKQGLSSILRRRGLQFVLFELVANAWDSKATECYITLEPVEGRRLARLTIEDNDPQGFQDITHAYVMFADSLRRNDPELRGRFNIGEKLVLAIADEAEIVTTTAAFRFDRTGRHRMNKRTEKGSKVDLTFPATRPQIQEILEAAQYLIPPIPTWVNGQRLKEPTPEATFDCSLETVLPDAEGNLQPHIRKTTVAVYSNPPGRLYELGIPVVETQDTFSYNVHQKVPLNMDRDNVSPSYLRTLRVFAANELHNKLNAEDCNSTWVRDALADKRIAPQAVQSAVKQRFGDKVVSFDPSDPEANKTAVSKGYVVVTGKQMGKAEWENVRNAGAIRPAGQVCPTPEPFSPDGDPINVLPEAEWTDGMRQIVTYTKRLFYAWFKHSVTVEITKPTNRNWSAAYGNGSFYFSLTNLKRDWFDQGITEEVVSLLIHEGGHEYASDHLSSKYHEALCDLGARMRDLKYLEQEIERKIEA